jgi:hypothetical protein
MSKGAGPAVQRTVVDSPFAAGQKNIWTDIIDKNKVEAKAEAKEKGGAHAQRTLVKERARMWVCKPQRPSRLSSHLLPPSL